MSRVDLIPETILACCVLHNICIDHLDQDIDEFILHDDILHDDILHDEAVNNEVTIEEDNEELNPEEDMEGINKRNEIALTLRMLN